MSGAYTLSGVLYHFRALLVQILYVFKQMSSFSWIATPTPCLCHHIFINSVEQDVIFVSHAALSSCWLLVPRELSGLLFQDVIFQQASLLLNKRLIIIINFY